MAHVSDPVRARPRAWEWSLAALPPLLGAGLAYPWGYALITGMLVGRPDGGALWMLAGVLVALLASSLAVASRPRLVPWRGAVAGAALLLVAAAGAAIVFLRVADTPVKWPAALLYVAASLLPVGLATILLWPPSWPARGGGLALMAGALVAFLGLVRVDGLSGDAQVVFGWRRTPVPGALPARTAESAPAETVLAPGPGDFAAYLGPGRDGRLGGPAISRDWSRRPPSEVWRRRVGPGWGGFAVVGDAAITQEQRGDSEAVVCYDLATGAERWIHAEAVRFDSSLGGPGPRGTPTVVGGRVYAMGATGRLVCLAQDGALVWRVDTVPGAESRVAADGRDGEPAENGELLPHGMAGSPLVVDGRVYVCPCGRDGRSLAAFDAERGTEIFRAGSGRASYASPMEVEVAGERFVMVFNGRGVAAHDPLTGAVAWSFPWTNDVGVNCAQPIVVDDTVLLSTGYGTGSVLLALTRGAEGGWDVAERWRSRDLKSKFATPVRSGDVVYGLDDGILAAIDLATGKRLWKRGRYGHGQLLLVGDLLLVQTEGGPVVLVEPGPGGPVELGTLDCLADKTWNTLALAGDRLLARNSVEAACYRLPLAAPAGP